MFYIKQTTLSLRLISSLFLLLTIFQNPICAQQTDPLKSVNIVKTDADFSPNSFLTTASKKTTFPLVANGKPASILVSESDFPGVLKIAGLFRQDLTHVSGNQASLEIGSSISTKNVIIAGTLGKSPIIDSLINSGKIDVSDIIGKWETFKFISVETPLPGVDNGLVIVGSDKRGTIFGLFELSSEMGVSPWYWWADTPIQSRENIYFKPKSYTAGEPKVKYRGIFLNDEEPALGNWAREKFGDLNSEFYGHVFELILRLKGNYLWPAMWGKSLWDEDPLSAPLADEMGIVLATSHHEPLMRAHVEWNRYGKGAWNYETNPEELQEFWREGMERTKGQEKVVTLAMRGDGDEAMSEGTNIELLEKIVADQRKIIEEVTGKPASETPQVWALYKEVQDYFDKGMRVPDDVTLLLCDDNWSHVRILPEVNAKPRTGGYGMYYHFDYVGGPRSYKWLNTVQLERVWEQMRLTYEYGVREIWLVNVGDLKPMELPISFFLDYAWNPESITANDLPDYYTKWASAQFGNEWAPEIGALLKLYTKYNSRRKPELINTETYSLTKFNEADRVVGEYNSLMKQALLLEKKLPMKTLDAYYQLVLHPIEANATLNEMYVSAAKNRLYKMQNRASTNWYADHTKTLFFKSEDFKNRYHQLADGKWNHMMNQTYMGHVNWQDPPVNKMPEISYVQTAENADLGMMLESPAPTRWGRFGSTTFTSFDPLNDQEYFVELYNTGNQPLDYTISSGSDWIHLSSTSGTIEFDEKVLVSINWSMVPAGTENGTFTISGAGRDMTITVPLKTDVPNKASGFISNNGIVSINAANFANKHEAKPILWEVIPNLGRTASSVTSTPVTSPKQKAENNSSYLEYPVYLLEDGVYDLELWFSPTLNFQKDEGLQYAVSIDGSTPKVMNLHENAKAADWTYPEWWNNAVTDNIMKQRALESELSAGSHIIRYYLVDPGLVLQKIQLVKKGAENPTYLGAPESVYK